ncbi:NADH-dependent flavin oxidoreductase [Staphylococcus auricularis]|uniref:NADH-dependent flavin oxidoreductase n=1 Tax=Staphylococcus auricularis TaxID=29379 RepID=UPI003EBEBB2B
MNEKFKPLFDPLTLPNGAKLKNRFALAPLTHVSSHEDGTVSDEELEHMALRSKDVGLAITAASFVTDIGKAFPGEPSVAHDLDVEGMTRLAKEMKKNGAKAVVQIHHGGAQGLPEFTPNGDVAAPSPVDMESFGYPEHHARELTHDEIEATIHDFGEATRRAIEAGFDGVELHGANHYLLHQFVSPYYNRRDDQWGEDRLLFPRRVVDEVVDVVQKYADDDFIIGYRLSPEEAEKPGITMEITETLVNMLLERPIDYIHISLWNMNSTTREGKYQGENRLKTIHDWINGRVPLIGIGQVYDAERALEAINSGDIELVALGRGILLDAEFISKLAAGKEDEIDVTFDPEREDLHQLPPKLWEQFNKGFYRVPRKDDQA